MTDPTTPTAPGERGRPGFWRSPWPWAVLAGLIFIPAIRPFLRFDPPPPPVLGQVPAFELVASDGRPFGDGDLEGEIWIADFFFTRCTSICPLLTAAMGRLDSRLREAGVDDIHLVSISVDPQHDTPEVLAEYGRTHGIDPARWTLLTGPPDDVRALVVDGFKTAMGEPRETAPDMVDIAHLGRFVLVDAEGGIRGYYGVDESGLDEIFHRGRTLRDHLARGR